jgi:hypothetical protein
MSDAREVTTVLTRQPTMEGAGVRLHRVFGFTEQPRLDPFLLLDEFGSDDPEDYLAGFPWHPHRGIETVTYMLAGEVEHGDSLGNRGVIRSGDVQWMTAGSGIVHQEMPKRFDGRMRGFQLWVNLPASHKMMDPRYRDVAADTIPEVAPAAGVRVRVIAGTVAGVSGPVRDVVADPEYLDVTVAPGAPFERELPSGHVAFAYGVDGAGRFGPGTGRDVTAGQLAVLGGAGPVRAVAGGAGLRFLLVSGKPLGEPVAWRGPIVMNTEDELRTAFQEYRQGTFIKSRS